MKTGVKLIDILKFKLNCLRFYVMVKLVIKICTYIQVPYKYLHFLLEQKYSNTLQGTNSLQEFRFDVKTGFELLCMEPATLTNKNS